MVCPWLAIASARPSTAHSSLQPCSSERLVVQENGSSLPMGVAISRDFRDVQGCARMPNETCLDANAHPSYTVPGPPQSPCAELSCGLLSLACMQGVAANAKHCYSLGRSAPDGSQQVQAPIQESCWEGLQDCGSNSDPPT